MDFFLCSIAVIYCGTGQVQRVSIQGNRFLCSATAQDSTLLQKLHCVVDFLCCFQLSTLQVWSVTNREVDEGSVWQACAGQRASWTGLLRLVLYPVHCFSSPPHCVSLPTVGMWFHLIVSPTVVHVVAGSVLQPSASPAVPTHPATLWSMWFTSWASACPTPAGWWCSRP